MQIIQKLTIDMANPRMTPPVNAVQGDANTRAVEVALLENGVAWTPPAGISVSVAFRKADGTQGWYDKLPNDTAACSVTGNTVTAILAPQVLTAAGITDAAIVFQDSKTLDQLATFPFRIRVARNPSAGQTVSNDYYNYSTMAGVNDAMEAWLDTLESAIKQATDASTNANASAALANAAATNANTATAYANAAADACQNIAAGINSMADKSTGKTYTIGIEAGNIYLQEV